MNTTQNYQTIGNYLLLEKVAAGGMAEVFLARLKSDMDSYQFFILKKILPGFESSNLVNYFKEEIKIAKNLNHKNIVQFCDYGNEDGQHYIAMEFINGMNLHSLMIDLENEKKQLPLEMVLYVISEIALGLDSAHRAIDSATQLRLNIVHRDLNPQNIMISFEGSIKIIDFGIARGDLRAEKTEVGMLKGKFNYMSPEQTEGITLDSRTDVFALGIVLWELITSQRLFKSVDDFATVQKVRLTVIPPIVGLHPDATEDLQEIVFKTLARDPNHRYQTAADFQFAINKYLVMHYPTFRPFQFNEFMKKQYTQGIQERTEKLTKYSKLLHEESDRVKSQKQFEVQERETENEANEQLAGILQISKDGLTDGIAFGDLNFHGIKSAEGNQKVRQKAMSFNVTERPIFREPIRKSSRVNPTYLIYLAIALLASFSVYKVYFKKVKITENSSVRATAVVEKKVIYKATQNEPDFSTEIYAKLKKSGKVAYVDIQIIGDLKNAKLFVDGKEIYEKPPLHNYPILAGKLIKIKALNPDTNYSDEQEIEVASEKTFDLKLNLIPDHKTK